MSKRMDRKTGRKGGGMMLCINVALDMFYIVILSPLFMAFARAACIIINTWIRPSQCYWYAV